MSAASDPRDTAEAPEREPGLTTRDKIVLVATVLLAVVGVWVVVRFWDGAIATVRR